MFRNVVFDSEKRRDPAFFSDPAVPDWLYAGLVGCLLAASGLLFRVLFG